MERDKDRPYEYDEDHAMGHALTRALERHGLDLTDMDLREIVTRIQKGGEGVRRDPIHNDIWQVMIEGHWIPVVFKEETGHIHTVLPGGYDKKKRKPPKKTMAAFKDHGRKSRVLKQKLLAKIKPDMDTDLNNDDEEEETESGCLVSKMILLKM